jgi:hypothetical protein
MNTFGQFGFMGCAICGKPLRLATAKSDNGGLPFHDECKVLRLKLKQATTPTSPPSECDSPHNYPTEVNCPPGSKTYVKRSVLTRE